MSSTHLSNYQKLVDELVTSFRRAILQANRSIDPDSFQVSSVESADELLKNFGTLFLKLIKGNCPLSHNILLNLCVEHGKSLYDSLLKSGETVPTAEEFKALIANAVFSLLNDYIAERLSKSNGLILRERACFIIADFMTQGLIPKPEPDSEKKYLRMIDELENTDMDLCLDRMLDAIRGPAHDTERYFADSSDEDDDDGKSKVSDLKNPKSKKSAGANRDRSSESDFQQILRDVTEKAEAKSQLRKRTTAIHQSSNPTSDSPSTAANPSSSPFTVYRASGPMKLALSSANNSDRHGAAKLEGSMVLNMAVDLVCPSGSGESDRPEPPIDVTVCRIRAGTVPPTVSASSTESSETPESIRCDEPTLFLHGYNDLRGHFADLHSRWSRSQFHADPTGETWRRFWAVSPTHIDRWNDPNTTADVRATLAFSDTRDEFRLFRFALFFAGVFPEPIATYVGSGGGSRPADSVVDHLWTAFTRFTAGASLYFSVVSRGPSSSGFSSSSAVLSTMLTALYALVGGGGGGDTSDAGASVRSALPPPRSSVPDLALAAENKLGLRSGWNDTYALLPGIHSFRTLPTDYLPEPVQVPLPRSAAAALAVTTESPPPESTPTPVPSVSCDDQLARELPDRLWLVHTGLQRLATGRMNRRHEVYLSKDPELYPFLLSSMDRHREIEEALSSRNWAELGRLCTEYKALRVAFDAAATNEYLDGFFRFLSDRGLIHGGLLAGAMGGGVAQIVVTDAGLERMDEGSPITKLEVALKDLSELTFPDGKQPFKNALFRRIPYAVNQHGIRLWTERCLNRLKDS